VGPVPGVKVLERTTDLSQDIQELNGGKRLYRGQERLIGNILQHFLVSVVLEIEKHVQGLNESRVRQTQEIVSSVK